MKVIPICVVRPKLYIYFFYFSAIGRDTVWNTTIQWSGSVPDSMGEVLGVARKLGDTFSTGLDSLGR